MWDGLNGVWVELKNSEWVKFKDYKCLKRLGRIIKRRKDGLKGEKWVKFITFRKRRRDKSRMG